MTTATAAPGVGSDSEDEAGSAAGRHLGRALQAEPSDDLEMRFLQVCRARAAGHGTHRRDRGVTEVSLGFLTAAASALPGHSLGHACVL